MVRKTYIVMSVANEEAGIESLLNTILSLEIPGLHIVTVMDDYSRDRTFDIIKEMSERNPSIDLLFYEKSFGFASCYLYGFKYAIEQGADYIIEMDAGWSHDPMGIPNYIKYLDEGYDCVFSSRFIKGAGIENHPLYRRLVSKWGTILANLVLGTKLSDMTSGYEAFRSEVLREIDLDNFISEKIPHFLNTELRYYCKRYRLKEIPIVYKGSTSTLRLKTVVKSLFALFALRRRPV